MSGRLRILVLFGGIPLWGQELGNIEVIDALVKEAGAECLFVTNRGWGHEAVQPELDRRGLPWTTAPYVGRLGKAMPPSRWISNIRTILVASLTLVRIMRRFRPTHIHVCNPAHFLNFLPVLLLTRTPVIYRLGDRIALHHPAYRFLWRRLIAPRVAEFVCVSKFIAQDLSDALGRRTIRTTVIYTRPPARHGSVQPLALPPLESSRITFVYLGQIAAHKGIELLIESASALRHRRDFSVLIAGDDNRYADQLRARVRDDGLEGIVIFLGRVDDVDRLFERGDVHVCPSLDHEGLPLVAIEAKLAGRASIVFPTAGLPEVVSHMVDGYVCPLKTADALRDACLSYLDDPDQARRQGCEARRSLERLGVFRFSARWQEVYERTARG